MMDKLPPPQAVLSTPVPGAASQPGMLPKGGFRGQGAALGSWRHLSPGCLGADIVFGSTRPASERARINHPAPACLVRGAERDPALDGEVKNSFGLLNKTRPMPPPNVVVWCWAKAGGNQRQSCSDLAGRAGAGAGTTPLPLRAAPAGNSGSLGNEGCKGAAVRSLPACLAQTSLDVTPAHPRVAGRWGHPPVAGMAAHAPHCPIAHATAHPAPPATQIWLLSEQYWEEMGRPLPPDPASLHGHSPTSCEAPISPRAHFDLPQSWGQYHCRGLGAARGVRQVQPHISG